MKKIGKIVETIERKRLLFSLIASLIFSTFLLVGAEITVHGRTEWSLAYFLRFLAIFVVLALLFYVIFNIKIAEKNDEITIPRWKIFLILIIPSIFLLWAVYPGIFSWDSGVMYHYYATGEYTTHFSLIISWLLGFCVNVGRNLFGSDNIGLALFLLIQIIAANIAITEAIHYLSKKLKSKPFLIVCVIYFITHLLIQNMLITAHQDVIFGSFIVLLGLEFVKMVEDESYFTKKKNWLKVGLFVFLMCAVRNNGFFALIPTLLIGFIFFKGNRKNFLFILLLPTLVFQGYKHLIVNKIVVYNEPTVRESLNVPILQIARTMYYTKDKSFDDRLYPFFGNCNWDLYKTSFDLSDDFKECMNNLHMTSHKMEFVSLWAEIGLKYPEYYFDAPFALTQKMFYPWTKYNHDESSYRYHTYAHHSISYEVMREWDGVGVAKIKEEPNIPILKKILKVILTKQYWGEIYGFRIIWSGAFTTYLLIIVILFALYKKLYKYMVPLGLIFGVLLTVALAPTVFFRYMFPVVISFPIMAYVLVKSITKDKKQKKKK